MCVLDPRLYPLLSVGLSNSGSSPSRGWASRRFSNFLDRGKQHADAGGGGPGMIVPQSGELSTMGNLLGAERAHVPLY